MNFGALLEVCALMNVLLVTILFVCNLTLFGVNLDSRVHATSFRPVFCKAKIKYFKWFKQNLSAHSRSEK